MTPTPVGDAQSRMPAPLATPSAGSPWGKGLTKRKEDLKSLALLVNGLGTQLWFKAKPARPIGDVIGGGWTKSRAFVLYQCDWLMHVAPPQLL